MNQRALIGALVLAAFGASLLLFYLKRYEQRMSGGAPVTLLTVVSPIERGTVLTEKLLASRDVPMAYVEDRAVRLADKAKILGLTTATRLNPNETLMWSDLELSTDQRDVSALVQPGKRAVTVPTTVSDPAQPALIRPGDYVDVVATLRREGELGEVTSAVLLQRVLVLAVGNTTQSFDSVKGSDDAAGARDRLLTLSLSIQEMQLLTLALERGRLSVAVRNPHDHATELDIPDLKASALLDTRARAELQRPLPRRNGVPAPPTRLGGSAER